MLTPISAYVMQLRILYDVRGLVNMDSVSRRYLELLSMKKIINFTSVVTTLWN